MGNESTAATTPPRATAGSARLVEDVMTRAVYVAYPGAAAEDIARVLLHHGIDAVPVIDEDRRVIGMVSRSDVYARSSRGSARAGTARELMTSPAVTVTVGTPIAAADALMAVREVRSVPVVTPAGALAGMLARADTARAPAGTGPDAA